MHADLFNAINICASVAVRLLEKKIIFSGNFSCIFTLKRILLHIADFAAK